VEYPSGAIRYTLGGDGSISHTHAPEVQADGSILLFDNGNGHLPRESTVKIFDLDEATGVFTEIFRWGDDPPLYDFALGDADRLGNGNILATFGVTANLIEITPDGRKVWELDVDDTGVFWVYRTHQVPEERIPPGVLPFR
jgi:outer membrane protein assembly factor BamB